MEKHRKPWYRLRNIVLSLLLIVVLAIGWVCLEIWAVYASNPKVTRNYRWEFRVMSEKAAGATTERGDATWQKLLEATELSSAIVLDYEDAMRKRTAPTRSGADPYDIPSVDFDRVVKGRSPQTNIEPELAVLSKMRDQGVFRILGEFAQMGVGFRAGDNSVSFIEELVPELNDARRLAKARAASMRLAQMAGDQQDVADAFKELLALARTISHQPGALFHLVGQSIQAAAVFELTAILLETDFDYATCLEFMNALDQHPMAPASLGLEGERKIFADFVQRLYTDDGNGDGYLNFFGLADLVGAQVPNKNPRSIVGSAVGRFVLATRKESIECYDEFIDECIREAALFRHERWNQFDPEAWTDSLPQRHVLVKIMAPALGMFVDNATFTFTQRQALRLMIALQAYRAMYGEFPESIELLVPDILPTLPADPTHGGPFVYRRVNEDAHGRAYLLYSTGLDETDDGGRTPTRYRERYFAITSNSAKGTDCVFNIPRPEAEETD